MPVTNDIILLDLASHEPSLTILRDVRPSQPSQEEPKHVSPPSAGAVEYTDCITAEK